MTSSFNPVIVQVKLPKNSYPIYIGTHLLSQPEYWAKHITGKQVLIVSNSTIAPLYLASLKTSLAHYHCETFLLADGEQYKTIESFNAIIDHLIECNFNRNCTVIALGGGVIGDLAGFAAACYLRGVNYIQIPTTLLAQVDSSIGGKTAVNHSKGKNLIGAFHQPSAVIIDLNTLHTLPKREFSAGLAEIIKHVLITDANYLHIIENNLTALLTQDLTALQLIIKRSCEIKAGIVSSDEKETQNQRVLLNFGHTFAHAIENSLGYGTLLHGEAVAIGMVLAAKLSQICGYLTQDEVNKIKQILIAAKLPVELPEHIKPHDLIALFKHDKKNLDSGLQFILLESLGKGIINDKISLQQLTLALEPFNKD